MPIAEQRNQRLDVQQLDLTWAGSQVTLAPQLGEDSSDDLAR
jgi:hypothetical protein